MENKCCISRLVTIYGLLHVNLLETNLQSYFIVVYVDLQETLTGTIIQRHNDIYVQINTLVNIPIDNIDVKYIFLANDNDNK